MRLDDSGCILQALNAATPLLVAAEASCTELDGRISSTAGMAHHIVRQVRELDVAQSRLQLVIARVDSVLDVTTSIDAVQHAIASNDYEQAAVRPTFSLARAYRVSTRVTTIPTFFSLSPTP
jgi:hypothetical protein